MGNSKLVVAILSFAELGTAQPQLVFSFSGNKGCTAVIGVMAVKIATSINFFIQYDGSN